MRKITALIAVLAIAGALVAAQAFASTTSVSWHVGTKKTVKIHKGSSVKWVWTGDSTHDAKGKGFKSKTSSKKGFTFTHRFLSKGTFTVTCTFHPGLMKTVVKVG